MRDAPTVFDISPSGVEMRIVAEVSREVREPRAPPEPGRIVASPARRPRRGRGSPLPLTQRALVLQLVARKPRFGLEIIEDARQLGAALHQGSVYPALRQLEKAGLLESRTEKTGDGRPRIRYGITPRGAQQAALEMEVIAAIFDLPARGSSHGAPRAGRKKGARPCTDPAARSSSSSRSS